MDKFFVTEEKLKEYQEKVKDYCINNKSSELFTDLKQGLEEAIEYEKYQIFDPGVILYNDKTGDKGIALTTSERGYVYVLRYDFTTDIEDLEDVRQIGYSDAIYKSMYELNNCKII